MEETSSEEQTFKQYTPAQAKAYAAIRGGYHDRLFNVILDHHKSTGGSFHALLDVGCGPGNATRPLAKHFEVAYGLDPSPEMINVASEIGKETGAAETTGGRRIEYVLGRAEDISWLRDSGRKVDLLVSAMAVHWFDMPRFWASAAQVLNAGGTVALWTRASSFCHPSTPNATQVQETMLRLEREELGPYELPGNRLARDAYDNLPLPWDIRPPVEGFSQAGFTRLDWDRDGQLSEPDHIFLGDEHVTLAKVQAKFSTASMVTRWREAHPELANTEQDVVSVMVKELRKELGREDLVVGSSCHLLLLKRDA